MAVAHTLPSAGQPSFIPDYHQRQQQMEEFGYIYKKNPAMLPLSGTGLYSWIGATGIYGNGDLHHPQASDKILEGRFLTESFLRFEDTGWTLHGQFEYVNGKETDGGSNLSYKMKDHGTPSFYFCRKPADRWGIREYGLSATAAKDFGPRWTVGLLTDYRGLQHFRSNDVRNDQTSLNLDLVLSASFHATPASWFSLGAAYSRNKEQPSFSNLYSSGPEYAIYLMNGLGTYIKNVSYDMSWNEHIPGVQAQWECRKEKWQSSLSYDFSYGKNYWKSMISQEEEAENRWTGYHFMEHDVRLMEKFFSGASEWTLLASYERTSGSGKNYENASKTYTRNYIYIGNEAQLILSWRGKLPVLRRLKAAFTFQDDQRQDKSYAYTMMNSNLTAHLLAGMDWKAGKATMSTTLEGSYLFPIRTLHNPGAADTGKNPYCEYIAKPLAAWQHIQTANAGLTLQADLPVRKNTIEAGISADALFCTGGPAEYIGHNYLSANLFFNVYF